MQLEKVLGMETDLRSYQDEKLLKEVMAATSEFCNLMIDSSSADLIRFFIKCLTDMGRENFSRRK